MQIINDIKLDFSDVLIIPKRSEAISRADIVLERTFKFQSGQTWTGVPIIAANMDATGSMQMARTLSKYKMLTCLHKHYAKIDLINFFTPASVEDEQVLYNTFYTLGIRQEDLNKLKEVERHCKIDKFCIDVPNGYINSFTDMCKRFRDDHPDAIIMAGNVCTKEMAQELILSCGIDISKAGIGGGSACLTRVVSGVGYPQLSTIIECADAAHGLNGYICSDGGCVVPGDVAKAFGAGSDFVMLGGMLAGTDECEGEWEYEPEKRWKNHSDPEGTPQITLTGKSVKKNFKFYGMSSKEANEKYNGGLSEYKAAEGKVVSIPYKGSVSSILQEILGGLRSACSYIGAKKLKDIPKCTTFVRVNRTHNTVYGNTICQNQQ